MRKTVLISLLAAALASPAQAEPAGSPGPAWLLEVGAAERWPTSPSMVTLTESNLEGIALGAERRVLGLALPGPFPRLDLSAGIGFERTSVEGMTFDQLRNDVSAWHLTAAARAWLPLRWGLSAHARAAVGGGDVDVRIASAQMSNIAISDGTASMVVQTGAGLAFLPRLTSQSSSPFHLGFEVELGYTMTTSQPIHAYPADRAAADLTIPASYAALGDLDLDGWTLRLGVAIGF